MATFSGSISNITSSSALWTAKFTGGDSSYAKSRYAALYLDGVFITNVESAETSGGTNNFTWKFNGLDSDTYYTWEAVLCYIDSNGSLTESSYSDSGSFTTEQDIPAIDYWSWTANTARETFHSVLTGELPANPENCSSSVWNALVDKINEVLVAYGYSWDSTYASLAGTKVSAGQTLSAVKYNSALYNISRRTSVSVGYVTANVTELTGNHILELADAINRAIG